MDNRSAREQERVMRENSKAGSGEAKTKLSTLIERARRGERIVLTKKGIVVALILGGGGRREGHVRGLIRKGKRDN